MINEIRQEINLSPDLEKKINWAVKYASIKVKVQKGALIRLEPTNMLLAGPSRYDEWDEAIIEDLHKKVQKKNTSDKER